VKKLEELDEKLKKYPRTKNFHVIGTIGVPHPFCITEKHVVHAADNYSSLLGKDAIENLEKIKQQSTCGVKGCALMYDEHEQALAVHCKVKDNGLLEEYLKSIVDLCEADGYAGFVLIDATKT